MNRCGHIGTRLFATDRPRWSRCECGDLVQRERRRGERGTRVYGGRYFILAGRGTRETCERERIALLKRWRYVRVVAANRDAKLVDDFMLYVFEARS